jgi:hypothetical protein
MSTAKEGGPVMTTHADDVDLRRRAAEPAKTLPPAAERALVEAAARRAARDAAVQTPPAEHGGQKGPDPARYGDWEKAGIVSDF